MERAVIAAGMHRIPARNGVLEVSWLPGLGERDRIECKYYHHGRGSEQNLVLQRISRAKLYIIFPCEMRVKTP